MSSSYRPLYGQGPRDSRGSRDPRDYRDHHDSRDGRDSRDYRDYRDYHDYRERSPHSRPPPPMPYFGKDIGAHNNFSFRGNNIPRYPQGAPSGPRNANEIAQRHERHAKPHNGFGPRAWDGGRLRRNFIPYQKPPTSQRALLRYKEAAPENLGRLVDSSGGPKFINMDDVSDSADESMEESDSDEDVDVPAVKRHRKTTATAEKQAPKWSNPEVYTSLPPDEDNDRKRKDVVKLIRKARVAAAKDKKAEQAANDQDFISFDFLEDEGRPERKATQAPMQPQAIHELPPKPVGYQIAAVSQPAPTESLPDKAQAPTAVGSAAAQPANITNLPNKTQASSIVSNTASKAAEHNAITQGTNFAVAASNLPSLVESEPRKTATTALDVDSSIAGRLHQLGVDRKRKREDTEEDQLIAPTNKKGRGQRPSGNVLAHWADTRSVESLPWFSSDACLSDNPSFRLHQEICDFYRFVRPRYYEHKVRVELLERLQATVVDHGYDAAVRSFGSFAAGLYLPNADMDVVLISQQFFVTGVKVLGEKPRALQKLGDQLVRKSVAKPHSVEAVPFARVPLVKYVDRLTGIRVDVSFDNHSGVIANGTYEAWKTRYPALPILTSVIKQFLMMRGLNAVPTGGIGGFTVTCLVVSILHNTPRFQHEDFHPEDHLGEVLLEFLDFYGNKFDYQRSAIRMVPPSIIEKHTVRTSKKLRFDRLCILDPNVANHDISGGSSAIGLIFERFAAAHGELCRAMARNKKFLLASILAGNYNDFLWHRRELRKVYESQYGSIEPGDD